MTKTPISLQDLRRSLYVKAKAEPTWRFWGLYVHVCKMETLQEAYRMAKSNDGAPGIEISLRTGNESRSMSGDGDEVKLYLPFAASKGRLNRKVLMSFSGF